MRKVCLYALFLAVLAACQKPLPQPEPAAVGEIRFSFSLQHPGGTKAVKTAWEAGDVVFVFFSGVQAPKYLRLCYDASTDNWTPVEMNGTSPGSLGLTEGQGGTMRAVYLPFGNALSVLADGGSFRFSDTQYSYYLTASLPYSVSGGVVSGDFPMTVPEGYVQFFVEDAAATDGAYALGTDAVVPVGVLRVDASGTLVETADKNPGDDMPGYAYQGGHLFSGKMDAAYAGEYGSNYYFALKKTAGGSRKDYFVSGKALESHKSVKLPALSSDKWQAVGADVTVNLGAGYSTWYTCNYGSSVPEGSSATGYDYATARAGSDPNRELPSTSLFNKLLADFDWTWMSVHGQLGMVVSRGGKFLFLPAFEGNDLGWYWLMRVGTVSYRSFTFDADPASVMLDNASSDASSQWLVRHIYTE